MNKGQRCPTFSGTPPDCTHRHRHCTIPKTTQDGVKVHSSNITIWRLTWYLLQMKSGHCFSSFLLILALFAPDILFRWPHVLGQFPRLLGQLAYRGSVLLTITTTVTLTVGLSCVCVIGDLLYVGVYVYGVCECTVGSRYTRLTTLTVHPEVKGEGLVKYKII